mgnify:CR=1 FL=1
MTEIAKTYVEAIDKIMQALARRDNWVDGYSINIKVDTDGFHVHSRKTESRICGVYRIVKFDDIDNLGNTVDEVAKAMQFEPYKLRHGT